MPDGEKTSWIYCNVCSGKTRHTLVASKQYNNDARVDDGDPSEWGEYRLWSCNGCDTCCMQDYYTADYLTRWNEDGEQENQVYESVYHPKRTSSTRGSKHFVNLPRKLEKLYEEVVSAYNESHYLLCAVGLRSLLEGVCAEKQIAGANLEKKIDGMRSLLPENIVKNLHEFRFMGNKAVHELEAPGKQDLGIALDIIEDILNFIYALDYKATLLGKVRAPQAAAKPLNFGLAVASVEAAQRAEPAEKKSDNT